jgi:hypothetical protein
MSLLKNRPTHFLTKFKHGKISHHFSAVPNLKENYKKLSIDK